MLKVMWKWQQQMRKNQRDEETKQKFIFTLMCQYIYILM